MTVKPEKRVENNIVLVDRAWFFRLSLIEVLNSAIDAARHGVGSVTGMRGEAIRTIVRGLS